MITHCKVLVKPSQTPDWFCQEGRIPECTTSDCKLPDECFSTSQTVRIGTVEFQSVASQTVWYDCEDRPYGQAVNPRCRRIYKSNVWKWYNLEYEQISLWGPRSGSQAADWKSKHIMCNTCSKLCKTATPHDLHFHVLLLHIMFTLLGLGRGPQQCVASMHMIWKKSETMRFETSTQSSH